MYSVDDRDRVVELQDVPQCETGAPLPLVLADDNHLLLGYLISKPDPNWDGTYVNVVGPTSEDRPVAIVRFDRPYAHMFGPPNDEAFGGHPLAARGLMPYGAFEVPDSSWIRALERMNSVHARHNREWFLEGKRHFIFVFHDSTFECVATNYVVERLRGSLVLGFDRMRELFTKSWTHTP